MASSDPIADICSQLELHTDSILDHFAAVCILLFAAIETLGNFSEENYAFTEWILCVYNP